MDESEVRDVVREPSSIERQFELAKLDYARLSEQEQALMSKREAHWTRFFTILVVPSGYAGVVGLANAIYLLALVPFFITCISLEVKHDEKVLRYDVRKGMKNLAATWGFTNHDSQFSKQDGARWWHGYYRYGRAAAFLVAQVAVAVIVSCNSGTFLYSIGLALVNTLFVLATAWCLF